MNSSQPSASDGAGARRAIVIGAGIVGAMSAAYLQREGVRVTLIEADEPAAGASAGNAGAISPGSCIPLSMPGILRKVPSWLFARDAPLVIRKRYLLMVSPWLARFIAAGRPERIGPIADALHALHGCVHACYRPILEAAGATDMIRRTGAMVVYRTAAALASAGTEWDMRRRRGVTFEILDARQIRDLAPELSPSFERAVFQPDHGYVTDPRSLVRRVVDHVRAEGAVFVRNRAVRFESEGDCIRVVLADGGSLAAERVVLAAGIGSGALSAQAGLTMPLESQRGYHLHLPVAGVSLPFPVSFAESKFYATPMATGLRLAGTVEFAGLTAPPNFERSRRLGRQAREFLPSLDLTDASEWMGHRPCLPDSLPVIGPLPNDPRMILAFGHGHNGMTSAPGTARLVADLVCGRKPFIDPSPYRADRFH